MTNNHYLQDYFDALCAKQIENKQKNIGIVQGSAGLALCCAHYYTITQDGKYYQWMEKLLLDASDNSNRNFSLGYGLAGFAWSIKQIAELDLLEGVNDWISAINTQLIAGFVIRARQRDVDFFSGLAGILHYFLLTGSIPKIEDFANAFIEIIDKMIKSNDFRKVGYDSEGNQLKVINLGIPHGIAGWVLLLLIIKEKNIHDTSSQINSLVNALLSYRHSKDKSCVFPSIIFENEIVDAHHIGWCYGDLVTSYTLLKAAYALDRKDLEELAFEIIDRTLNRTDIDVDELNLCHGYISVSVLFQKLYNLTGQARFDELSKKWHSQAEEVFKKGYAEYQETGKHSEYFEETSLFMGFPAFFLSMLQQEGKIDDKWCNCLML